MRRMMVNKKASARKFRRNVSRTKAANVPGRRGIMRGGQRM